MFENLYALKINIGKKVLRSMFAKILSFVLFCVLISVFHGGTAAAAADVSGGLEHWDKNEVYYRDGVKFSVNISEKNEPDWILQSVAEEDGKIDVKIHRYQCRDLLGYVSEGNIIELSGEKGKVKLANSGMDIARSRVNEIDASAFASEYPYFSYMGFNENEYTYTARQKEPLTALTGEDTCKYREIGVYFAFDDKLELQTAFLRLNVYKDEYGNPVNTKFDELRAETDLSYIGNFHEDFTVDSWFDRFDSANGYYFTKYFTMYENNYRNKKVDGINFEIEKASVDGIVVNSDITLWQAARVVIEVYNQDGRRVSSNYENELDVSKKQYVLTPLKTKIYDYSSDSKHPRVIRKIDIPENQFVSGEKYRVCIAILDVYRNFDVLYRWQEYVTMQ